MEQPRADGKVFNPETKRWVLPTNKRYLEYLEHHRAEIVAAAAARVENVLNAIIAPISDEKSRDYFYHVNTLNSTENDIEDIPLDYHLERPGPYFNKKNQSATTEQLEKVVRPGRLENEFRKSLPEQIARADVKQEVVENKAWVSFKNEGEYLIERQRLLNNLGLHYQDMIADIKEKIDLEKAQTIESVMKTKGVTNATIFRIEEIYNKQYIEERDKVEHHADAALKEYYPAFPKKDKLKYEDDGSLILVEKRGKTTYRGAYRIQNYKWAGHKKDEPAHITLAEVSATLYSLAVTIKGFRQFMIPFTTFPNPGEEADTYWRALPKALATSIQTIYSWLTDRTYRKSKAVSKAVSYSDMPDVYLMYLDLAEGFSIGYVADPEGGAKLKGLSFAGVNKHPHFLLQDPSAKFDNDDCLLAVLRCAANQAKCDFGGRHNQVIRRELNLGAGPIKCSTENLTKLANLFKLFIRVIGGVCVLPDSERLYSDNASRSSKKNMCLSEPFLHVIAEGGDSTHPPCPIYLDEVEGKGHYLYIAQFMEPYQTDEVTGDLLVNGAEFSAEYQQKRVLEQGRLWLSKEITPIQSVRPTHYTEKLVVFDYETVYNESGKLIPYALAFIVLPLEDINRKMYDRKVLASTDFSSYRDSVTICYGKTNREVNEPLLDLLRCAPPNVHYILLSFNGARFDNFLLANALHHAKMLNDIFATSQGLRGVDIKGGHRSIDLAKIVPAMSLEDACEDFQTKPTKLSGFSHAEVQQHYMDGKFDMWFRKSRERLSEYVSRDVLSTLSLACKVRQEVFDLNDIDIFSSARSVPGTIGGIAWKMMKKKCNLPKASATHEEDIFIRKAIVGGRVQNYLGKPTAILDEQLRMVDFTSLYPTVMACVPKIDALFAKDLGFGIYPTGNSGPGIPWNHEKDAYEPETAGMFFTWIISQNPDKPNVLPRRPDLLNLDENGDCDKDVGGSLDWAYKGEFFTYATHIDINLIRKYGGHAMPIEGFIWRNTEKGIFAPFINFLAAEKDGEDRKKKEDAKVIKQWKADEAKAKLDPETYPEFLKKKEAFFLSWAPSGNGARRMMLKLKMNAGSGKCCQANYEEISVYANGRTAQMEAEKGMDPSKPITWFPIGGDACVIVGSKPLSKVYKQSKAKPSILAVLIYSYSRALVYETLCQHNVLYSDTDSGLFYLKDYENLRAAFPTLDPEGEKRSKSLGDLEEELTDGDVSFHHVNAYLIAPKNYAIFLKDENDQMLRKDGALLKNHKLRSKGVNMRSDRLIRPEHLKEIESMSIFEKARELANIDDSKTEPLSVPGPNGKPEANPEPMERFFKNQTVEGTVTHVLCSQLSRSYKNDPNQNAAESFKLSQRFLVKKIGAPKKDGADIEVDWD